MIKMVYWISTFWILVIISLHDTVYQHVLCENNSYTDNSVEYYNGTIDRNVPTAVLSLSESEVYAMRFEFELAFEFPASTCCPIIDPVRDAYSNMTCFDTKELSVGLLKDTS